VPIHLGDRLGQELRVMLQVVRQVWVHDCVEALDGAGVLAGLVARGNSPNCAGAIVGCALVQLL